MLMDFCLQTHGMPAVWEYREDPLINDPHQCLLMIALPERKAGISTPSRTGMYSGLIRQGVVVHG